MDKQTFIKLMFISLVFGCGLLFPDAIQLQEVSVGARSFMGSTNDLMMEKVGIVPKHELSVRINTDIGDFFYWNNDVIGRTGVDSLGGMQFRSVAYSFQVGMRVMKSLDLEYSHRSSHILDRNFSYITEDSLGVRVYLFRNGWNNDEKTLFPFIK